MDTSSRVLVLGVALSAFVSVATSCGRDRNRSRAEGTASSGSSARDEASGTAARGFDVAGCDTLPTAACYRDTAQAGNDTQDPAGYPLADWILFAAGGDSIEIFAPLGGTVITSIGAERDSLHNNVEYFRRRVARDGVLVIWVSLDETQGPTAPYTLRVVSRGTVANPSLRPTGQSARLTVTSRRKGDVFSFVPVSIASTVRDRSPWKIYATTYKVALVRDSLYELCRLPCSAPDTIRLNPSTRVVKNF